MRITPDAICVAKVQVVDLPLSLFDCIRKALDISPQGHFFIYAAFLLAASSTCRIQVIAGSPSTSAARRTSSQALSVIRIECIFCRTSSATGLRPLPGARLRGLPDFVYPFIRPPVPS